jgi:lipoprotein-anchoring transpeptidase ErfK/SrfK
MMRFPLYRKTAVPFLAALAAILLGISVAPVAAPASNPVAETAPKAAAVATAETPASRPKAATLSIRDVRIRRELPITQWLKPGEYAWNDEGVPVGPVVIVVNIRARVMSVYRDGIEIGRSSVIYGSNEKPTPFGTFPILQKDANHRSTIYDGAPMPHMLRLTGDGVAIHGSEMADDYATHGCIGLPREFAALLFQAAHVGDPVLIWKGDRLGGAPGGEGEAHRS